MSFTDPCLTSSQASESCATESDTPLLLCNNAKAQEPSPLSQEKNLSEDISSSLLQLSSYKDAQKIVQNNPCLDEQNSTSISESKFNNGKIEKMECINYNGDLSESEHGGNSVNDSCVDTCSNMHPTLEHSDNKVDVPKSKSVNGFTSSSNNPVDSHDISDSKQSSLSCTFTKSDSETDKVSLDQSLKSDTEAAVKEISSSTVDEPETTKDTLKNDEKSVENDTLSDQFISQSSDSQIDKIGEVSLKNLGHEDTKETVSSIYQSASKESHNSQEEKSLEQTKLASGANSTGNSVNMDLPGSSVQLNTTEFSGVNLTKHQGESCSAKDSTSQLFINVNDTSKDILSEKVSQCKNESGSSISGTDANIIASDKDVIKSVHKDNQAESCSTPNTTEPSNEPSEVSFPNCFAGLVTIGKYIPVRGDFTLRSSEALIESPSVVVPFLLKEQDKFPPKFSSDESKIAERKSFFHSSVGEFLIGIGLSRVNEWFYRDMTRLKARQIRKGGRIKAVEDELERHRTDYLEAKKANEPFTFGMKKCEICDFTTESELVMEGHKLIPHITNRREYRCSYCTYISRDPREMLFHMEALHNKIGRIEPPVQFYECPFCPFENNSKGKLNNHLNKCQKYFDRAANQVPPKDFDYPAITPKPITVAVVKAYEKSINPNHRGRGRPKKNETLPENFHQHYSHIATGLPRTMGPNQNMPLYRQLASSTLSENLAHHHSLQTCRIPPPIHLPPPPVPIRPRHPVLGQVRPNPPQLHLPPANRIFQVVSSTGQVLPLLGNSHLVTSPSQLPLMPPNIDNSTICQKKLQSPQSMTLFTNMYGGIVSQASSSHGIIKPPGTPFHSGLKMAQPPKLQGPYPVQNAKPLAPTNSSITLSSLVVCEICDGYIKDLEQLRTHMQLIHKVKIHPKMLASRPPLNCQKCQWRFFTDQGLERHLLGAHGLVTSNMQELANKNQDSGCCTVCGRVYASKLVAHMSQVHKVTLKPAHLSYKCTVCSATFNLYKLFENHVYLVHSGAVKRPSEDSPPIPCKKTAIMDSSDESKQENDSNTADESENSNSTVTSEENKACVSSIPKSKSLKCKSCGYITNDILNHLKLKHMKKCAIKLCRIEKCEKCLCSSDSMVVIRMSDFGLKDEETEEEDSSEDSFENEGVVENETEEAEQNENSKIKEESSEDNKKDDEKDINLEKANNELKEEKDEEKEAPIPNVIHSDEKNGNSELKETNSKEENTEEVEGERKEECKSSQSPSDDNSEVKTE